MSNFGYRVLGFGGHTVAAAGDNITWSTTVSGTNANSKPAVYSMGFDTNDPLLSSAHGSIGDSTIDGMVGSNSGGAVTIVRCIWMNWNSGQYTFCIKLEEGGTANPAQTGWTSVTINSVTFLKADANFNYNRAGAHSTYNNQYDWSWITSSGDNPFGTTSNVTVDISMSNA